MKTLALPVALTLVATAQAATDPLIAQTLNQHYPVNADASARLARASDGKQRECHYYRVDDDEYCMTLHRWCPKMYADKRRANKKQRRHGIFELCKFKLPFAVPVAVGRI